MKIRFTILILLALGLTGCDCYVKVEGQILSSSTGKPISNAQITMVDQDRIVMTDENGQFMIDKVTGFCFDPEIEVAKDGYKIENKEEGIEAEWVEKDKVKLYVDVWKDFVLEYCFLNVCYRSCTYLYFTSALHHRLLPHIGRVRAAPPAARRPADSLSCVCDSR